MVIFSLLMISTVPETLSSGFFFSCAWVEMVAGPTRATATKTAIPTN